MVLCGLETAEVQSALEGLITQSHYAWKMNYSFAITVGTAVDFVHEDVFHKVCRVIILCPGCTPPPSLDYYYNIPTVAVPDCPPECLWGLEGEEFFYGTVSLSALRAKVLSLALTPMHIIYDSLLLYFTPVGELAAQRAFWILDKDCDGFLKQDDIVMWRRLIEKRDFESSHVKSFLTNNFIPIISMSSHKNYVENSTSQPIVECNQENESTTHTVDYYLENGLSKTDFVSYLLHLLQKEEIVEVWATLHAVGTQPDGLPYSWSDVQSARNPHRFTNFYLSPYGITFFNNVYKRAMPRSSSNVWCLTPGCPWVTIKGIPKENISCTKFIEAWKYMALEQPDTVIIYARFWGYKGSSMQLFESLPSRMRRGPSTKIPNCVQVLVVGMAGTGRHTLVSALVGEKPAQLPSLSSTQASIETAYTAKTSTPATELYVRTTTWGAPHLVGRSSAQPLTYVYTILPPSWTGSILRDELVNRTIDAVILCFDHTQPLKSIRFIANTIREARSKEGGCRRMPFLIIGTKKDLLRYPPQLPATQELLEFASFCQTERLMWPPMMINALLSPSVNAKSVSLISECLYHAIRDPHIAQGYPKLTPRRFLSRICFVGITSFLTWSLSRRVASLFTSIAEWCSSGRRLTF